MCTCSCGLHVYDSIWFSDPTRKKIDWILVTSTWFNLGAKGIFSILDSCLLCATSLVSKCDISIMQCNLPFLEFMTPWQLHFMGYSSYYPAAMHSVVLCASTMHRCCVIMCKHYIGVFFSSRVIWAVFKCY